MAITSITSKEKIKSLVISADRSFRSQTIRLFNDIAFPAEKISVGTVKEARAALQIDPRIENVLISSEGYDDEAVKGFLNDLSPYIVGKSIKVLVYLKGTQDYMIPDLEKTYPDFCYRVLPMKKADFIEIFHTSRTTALTGAAAGRSPIINPNVPAEPEAAAPPKVREVDTKTFFEATAHLRDAITSINALMEDQKDIVKFLQIGQRFNGIVGAFAFVREKPGYKQVLALATVLDDLGRTYQKNPDWTEVTSSHLGLTLRAVKCAFLILKDLREGQSPSDENVNEAESVFAVYEKAEEIVKRESSSQADVDALLDSLNSGTG